MTEFVFEAHIKEKVAELSIMVYADFSFFLFVFNELMYFKKACSLYIVFIHFTCTNGAPLL
jgi:hypothetical protein